MSERRRPYFLIPKNETTYPNLILGPFDSQKEARAVIPQYAGALKEPYHLVRICPDRKEKKCAAS